MMEFLLIIFITAAAAQDWNGLKGKLCYFIILRSENKKTTEGTLHILHMYFI